MDYATEIKKLRKSIGFTQKQLAEKVGMAEITISQYERGKRTPAIKQLKKIVDACEVPFDLFIMSDEELKDLYEWEREMQQTYAPFNISAEDVDAIHPGIAIGEKGAEEAYIALLAMLRGESAPQETINLAVDFILRKRKERSGGDPE